MWFCNLPLSLLSILSLFLCMGLSWWYFHIFACACSIFPTPFIKETVYSIVCCCVLCQMLIDHKGVGWFLCVVPLIYMPVLMPLPGYFDYNGLVVWFDIRYCDLSNFVLLSQVCWGYSGSFLVPHKFLGYLFYVGEIWHLCCNKNCTGYVACLG